MAYGKKQRIGLCISTVMCLMSSTLTLQAIPYHVDTTMQLGSTASSTSTALLSYYHRRDQSAFVVGQYQANNNNNNWIASAGLGYRHLFGNQLVIGAYVFGDLLHTNDAGKHYVLSPGLDMQMDSWRFATNVYVPLGSRKKIKDGSYFTFDQHTATEYPASTYEQSMLGADAMLTYMPKTKYNMGIGIGGYHYRAKKRDVKQQSNLTGIKGQLGYQPFDRIMLSGEYRYDKVNKSRYMLNVGLNLSPGPQDTPMRDKLNSAIDRNMNLNTTEQGMALTEQTLVSSQVSNVYHNIYFVHGTLGSSSGTGTHQDPYSSLDVALVANASTNNLYIWLAGDHTYTKESGNMTVGGDNTTIMGRSSDYQIATKGSDANAPVVAINNGGLLLSNGSHVEGFKLKTIGSTEHDPSDNDLQSLNYGIKNGAFSENVYIRDMVITSAVANSKTVKMVTSILNFGTVNFSGSNTMSATVGLDQGAGTAFGTYNVGSTNNFTGGGMNEITATALGDGDAHGVYNLNSKSNFEDGGINKITATTSGSGYAYGIANGGSGASSSFSGGGINTITATTSGSGYAYGIANTSSGASSSFSGGGINTITATTSGSGYAYGIANTSSSASSSFSGGGINTITATTSGSGYAYGIANKGSSASSSFSGGGINTITATTSGSGYAYGMHTKGTSSFANEGTNKITGKATGDGYARGIYNHSGGAISFSGTNIITGSASGSGSAYGIDNKSSISFTGGVGTNEIHAIAASVSNADPYDGTGTVTGEDFVICKKATNEAGLDNGRVDCNFPAS